MDDHTNASVIENLIDSRGLELPSLLKNRFNRLKGRRMTELLHADRPPGPQSIQLFSNDYLSLANHPAIVRAILAAANDNTDSLWMSSVFFRHDSPQRRLERRLADYLGAEDCMLAQSGYCANFGLLQSIAAPGIKVYIDETAHASLWHGVLASRATPHRFAHNDPRPSRPWRAKKAPGSSSSTASTVTMAASVRCKTSPMSPRTTHACWVVDERYDFGNRCPAWGWGRFSSYALS